MDDSKLNIGKEQVDDDIRKEMHDLKLNIGKEQVDDLKKKRILLHLDEYDEEGYTLLVDDGETKKDPSDEEDEFFKSFSTEESQEADEEAPFLFGDISELIQKRQQDCGVVIHPDVSASLPKTDC
ncbi:hypothetical protein POM88_038214 [Heracleum sosnowskyi]|uniref:Uncharacterized protein n=1 Tax=Heracleum sosnowskyi TaxID=360622 RepID=A0AAD8MGK6_9APIA|nr:hypothetical protein POM88_038214 [Heracleum sosnowskyi]